MRTVDQETYDKTMIILQTTTALPCQNVRNYEGTVVHVHGQYFLRTKKGDIPFTGNDCFLMDKETDDVVSPHKDIMKRYGDKKVSFIGAILDGELYPYGSRVEGDEKAFYTFSSIEMPLELVRKKEEKTTEKFKDLYKQADESGWQGLPPGSFQKLAERMISKK